MPCCAEPCQDKIQLLTPFFFGNNSLYYQCEHTVAQGVCRSLANVYYAAVRVFGGHDQTPGKRMNNGLLWEYHALVDIYEEEVRKAQAAGDLPLLQ